MVYETNPRTCYLNCNCSTSEHFVLSLEKKLDEVLN